MSDMLIRGLDSNVVKRLRAQAKRHGRSVQAEVRQILERAAGCSWEDARRLAHHWQSTLAGRQFPDSADLVREDRER